MINVQDYIGAVRNLATTTLRSVIGDITVEEVLSERDLINRRLEQNISRTLSPAAQEELRRRAVALVIDQGKSQTEAARLLGVSRQSVHRWVAAYRTGGARSLAARRRGRRPREQMVLTERQQRAICQTIQSKHPDQLRLPGFLWTRALVGELIARRYGVRLAARTVGAYLRRWGFSAQKPVRRAFEQDPEAVRAQVEEVYPQIAARAKRERLVEPVPAASDELRYGTVMSHRDWSHQDGAVHVES